VRSNPGNILDSRTLLPAFAIPAGQDGSNLSPTALLPGVINYQNQNSAQDLLADKKMHSLFFTASHWIGERIELLVDGRSSIRDVHYQSFAHEQLLSVPPTNPFYVNPFGESRPIIIAYNFLNDLGP